MSDDDVSIEHQADIDTIGAIAYAKGLGESMRAFWNSMMGYQGRDEDTGEPVFYLPLPEDMAKLAFEHRIGVLFEAAADEEEAEAEAD